MKEDEIGVRSCFCRRQRVNIISVVSCSSFLSISTCLLVSYRPLATPGGSVTVGHFSWFLSHPPPLPLPFPVPVRATWCPPGVGLEELAYLTPSYGNLPPPVLSGGGKVRWSDGHVVRLHVVAGLGLLQSSGSCVTRVGVDFSFLQNCGCYVCGDPKLVQFSCWRRSLISACLMLV